MKITREYALIDELEQRCELSRAAWIELISCLDEKVRSYACERARAVRDRYYGRKIYIRGLIEFSNYCKNDCLYCGLRRSNSCAKRYRLSEEQILACCEKGYELGFRTFVLQSGEDSFYTDEKIASLVFRIKSKYPDCALTLSIGEKSKESYALFRAAGADRYLLRHESANEEHYAKLHPKELSCANRKACLYNLKDLGYQVGAGFMVGAPGQTVKELAEDMIFLKALNPEMVGIGPFIPASNTPFEGEKAGTFEDTIYLLSLIRLMLPKTLLPATTALGTIHPKGRELGVQAGANVIMPNLSPSDARSNYLIYDNKLCDGDEAAEARASLEKRMGEIGYEIVTDRGDPK